MSSSSTQTRRFSLPPHPPHLPTETLTLIPHPGRSLFLPPWPFSHCKGIDNEKTRDQTLAVLLLNFGEGAESGGCGWVWQLLGKIKKGEHGMSTRAVGRGNSFSPRRPGGLLMILLSPGLASSTGRCSWLSYYSKSEFCGWGWGRTERTEGPQKSDSMQVH